MCPKRQHVIVSYLQTTQGENMQEDKAKYVVVKGSGLASYHVIEEHDSKEKALESLQHFRTTTEDDYWIEERICKN